MIVDAAGVVHEGNTALPRLHAVANAPIFSYDDASSAGRLSAVRCSPLRRASRQAAAVAIRILGGEKAGDIKVPPVRFCGAEVRLAADAALGNQREPPAARQPDLLSAIRVCGISTGFRSSAIIAAILAARRPDLLADLRAPAALACRGPFAQRHG